MTHIESTRSPWVLKGNFCFPPSRPRQLGAMSRSTPALKLPVHLHRKKDVKAAWKPLRLQRLAPCCPSAVIALADIDDLQFLRPGRPAPPHQLAQLGIQEGFRQG